MSVLIAAAFGRFLEQNRLQVVARRALQRRGLLSAFAALDFNNTADISGSRTCSGCCASCAAARSTATRRAPCSPRSTRTAAAAIDVLEFFRITDVLLLGFYRLPRRHAHHAPVTRFGRMRAALLQVVQSRWFNVLSALLIVLSFRRHLPLGGATSTTRGSWAFSTLIDGVITGCSCSR
jgi:hypothetical protein